MLRGFLVFLVAVFSVCFASAKIPRLASVTPEIYRGGRPDAAGIQQLAQMRVRTIINIDNNDAVAERERQLAEDAGITWKNEPMQSFQAPTDAQIDRLLAELKDPSLYPVFIHCHHGEDRTGLVIGLYRVEAQNWSARAAYQEMLERGFHPVLKGLDAYFHERARD